MTFDGEVRTVEGGTHADICGGAVDAAAEKRFGCVDTVGRKAFLLRCEIEGGENKAAASACAGTDFSSERKGAVKKSRGLRHASGADSGADGRTGNDCPANHDGRNAFDGEIKLAAQFYQGADVARLAMAETEILADEHDGCAQAVDEYAADKLLWRERGDCEIEMENERCVETKSFEARETLFERFELCGRESRTQNTDRMRGECNGRGEGARTARAFDNAAKNFLMAKVNAIKIPDGENGARIRVESRTPLFG